MAKPAEDEYGDDFETHEEHSASLNAPGVATEPAGPSSLQPQQTILQQVASQNANRVVSADAEPQGDYGGASGQPMSEHGDGEAAQGDIAEGSEQHAEEQPAPLPPRYLLSTSVMPKLPLQGAWEGQSAVDSCITRAGVLVQVGHGALCKVTRPCMAELFQNFCHNFCHGCVLDLQSTRMQTRMQ